MVKYIFQILGIMLINLFAFLGLGHILDLIFPGNVSYKFISIFLSLPFLIFLMWLYIQNTLKKLKDIPEDEQSNR